MKISLTCINAKSLPSFHKSTDIVGTRCGNVISLAPSTHSNDLLGGGAGVNSPLLCGSSNGKGGYQKFIHDFALATKLLLYYCYCVKIAGIIFFLKIFCCVFVFLCFCVLREKK
jgi:hypothetical protein